MVSERMPDARSVSVGVWVGVGGRDEDPAVSGASHFLEHLLFKGTDRRTARAIAEMVDATGGEMNAFTSKEYTAYYARVPAGDQELATALLADVIGEPALRAADVETERQVILEELHLQADDPDDVVFELLYEALFPGHPLGREVLGSEDSVATIARHDLVEFHDHWYRAPNLVVAAAGAVDHHALVEQVGEAFASRTDGMTPVRAGPSEEPVEARRITRPPEAAHVAGGWRERYRSLGEKGDRVEGFGKNGHAFKFRLAKAIDCTGELKDKRSFKDITELKRLLLADERAIARNLVHRFIVYSTGAPVSFVDRGTVEAILDRCADNDYGVRSLIHALVQTGLFLHK